MDQKQIITEFIKEFIPKGYSLARYHCSTVSDLKQTIQLVFKKKFEIELPDDNTFYLDIAESTDYPMKYEYGNKVTRKLLKTNYFLNSVIIQISPKVLRELRATCRKISNIGEEKDLERNTLIKRLDVFSKKTFEIKN